MEEECIFCQIAKHRSPAEIEYEDQDVIAFWDINKKAPVHVLVIPKKHVISVRKLTDTDVEMAGKLILAARRVAEKKGIDKDGFRLIINVGPSSGQIVQHLHLHLIGGRVLGPMG